MTRGQELRELEACASAAVAVCEWRAALPLLCRLILRAPRTFKNLPAAYAALAHAYVHLGRPRDAARAIRRALALAPDMSAALIVRELVREALGE